MTTFGETLVRPRIHRAQKASRATAIRVRDRLDGPWHDEDFADWYPSDGRPALSPAQPATVCVLQFLQNYHRDADGHLRWRTTEKEGGPGLPPSSRAVVSPYDASARCARYGHIIIWPRPVLPTAPT
ncbi:hypothetical protein [Streptomyces sp. NPDC001833]|uniref:hypothetical protein n=1 Tax=Streptomyces sp. NPDC001833 TaxID=3154658 RepID=UPI00332C7A55